MTRESGRLWRRGVLASVFHRALLRLKRVGELVQVGVESAQESLDGEPLDAASSSLDAGDVGRVHFEAGGKLLLRDPRLVAQRAQRTAEGGQFDISGGLVHDGRLLGIPGQGVVGSAHKKIVGARAVRAAGRRGTESSCLAARQPSYHPGGLASSPRAVLPGPPRQHGGTMSTTTPQGVLFSLTSEDRPWTVEELIREHDDRIAVEDALTELHGAGLVNWINKRVVCASRAALRAQELSL